MVQAFCCHNLIGGGCFREDRLDSAFSIRRTSAMNFRAMAKAIARTIPFYAQVMPYRHGSLYKTLLTDGHLCPPPYEVKRLTILEYAKLFKASILVETGTYLGDTVETLRNEFEHVFSIELHPDLFKRARDRFRKVKNVTI